MTARQKSQTKASATATASAIQLRGVHMAYPTPDGGTLEVLRGIDLDIEPGKFVAVTGSSGCGKSTLLNLLGALDQLTGGELFVDDLALHDIGEDGRVRYRREQVGFVFQFFHLLPTLDLADNVALPLRLQGLRREPARNRALEELTRVGLDERATVLPATLSGGEMQRAAVARALIHRPGLLLADEPTGNLDGDNALRVLEILDEAIAGSETTLVMVTHSQAVAERADREIRLRDGKLER